LAKRLIEQHAYIRDVFFLLVPVFFSQKKKGLKNKGKGSKKNRPFVA